MTKHSTNDTIDQQSTETSHLTQIFELIACTLAIYIVYLSYGLYHEKITRVEYDGERFKYSLFLTTLQCIGSSIWALILICIEACRRKNIHPTSFEPYHGRVINTIFDQVPKSQYLIIASSYSLAMLSSTAALSYLSYLIQALAKSSKLIPVMIGKIIRGHRYSIREYLHVLMITGGIILFTFNPKKGGSSETSLIGILLIIFSLAMDAVTGPTQDAINDRYKPSLSTMTFWINFIPAIAFFIASVISGEWFHAINFITRHKSIQYEIAIYCFLAAIGQSVILIALFKFNSMTLTIITTTRKFFSILASVFWFGHTLELTQWLGVLLVFVGIGADSHLKYMQKKHSHRHKHKDDNNIQDDNNTTVGNDTGDNNMTLRRSTRKTIATKIVVDSDDEINTTPKQTKITKSSSKTTTAKSQQRSTSTSRRKKEIISSDSDTDEIVEEPVVVKRTTRGGRSTVRA